MYSPETLIPLLEKAAKRMTSLEAGDIQETCPIGIIAFDKWEWPQGVGLYGLLRYYQETRKPEFLDIIKSWFDDRIREGLPEKNVNTMAPMLTLAYLYEITGEPRYRDICAEWAAWIVEKMPRTHDQGLQHIVSGETNPQQLWDDTLFMTVLFLAKMGVLLDQQSYIDESVRQFLVHIKYLFDKKSGLWFHGWTFEGHHNFASALWARGNCWITAGIPDFLEITNLRGGVRSFLIDTLDRQVAALARYQHQSGLWHTLLDDPQSYLETSATAGFGYGILKGIRKGYLDAKYTAVGEKALAATIKQIQPDGTVGQVSYGTGMGRDLEHYRSIPLCAMAYGQALTILILGEGLKLGAVEKKTKPKSPPRASIKAV